MKDLPDIDDIERWYPEHWSEIAGNYVMKAILQAFVRQQTLFNMLFTGDFRSGKNRTVALAILAFFCRNRTATLDPCHQCHNCKELNKGQHHHWGLLHDLEGHRLQYVYWASDDIGEKDLETLDECSNNEAQPVLLHIDEVDALPRSTQQKLLTRLDVRQTVFCIGTSASVKAKTVKAVRSRGARNRKLDKPKDPLMEALRLRFTVHQQTQRPDKPEMVEWLKDRCQAWKITPDADETLHYLADRTGCRPGLAQKVLGLSTLFNRRLTHAVVDYFNFDANA